jgi:antagonist of KipI
MLTVLKPGQQLTVQDAGRHGFQHLGVGPAGPMDWVAHAVANLAVGNDAGAAALEITGTQCALRFEDSRLAALAGRDGVLDGAPVCTHRPFLARAGQTLRLAQGSGAFRSYLALSGGISEAPVLGSRSASTVAGLGRYAATGLRAGERLALGGASPWSEAWHHWLEMHGLRAPAWSACPIVGEPDHAAPIRLRVIRHEQPDCPDAAWAGFLAGRFKIGAASNRMAAWLEGPPLPLESGRDIVSRGVVTGTVQLPPSGHPVILCADRQTVGGYPILGHVASIDLPLLARAFPHGSVSFDEVTAAEAQRMDLEAHRALQRLAYALRQQLPPASGHRQAPAPMPAEVRP